MSVRRPPASWRCPWWSCRRQDAPHLILGRVDTVLRAIKARLAGLDRFWEKEQTKADVEVFILDEVFPSLPTPPFTAEEKKL